MAHLLLVEDESIVLHFFKGELEAAGFHVIGASTIQDALTILRSGESIDLLLTDISINQDTSAGLSLAEEAVRLRPGLPVLYASGRPLTEALEKRLVNGSRFLGKPYSWEALLKEVNRCLMAEAAATEDANDEQMVALIPIPPVAPAT